MDYCCCARVHISVFFPPFVMRTLFRPVLLTLATTTGQRGLWKWKTRRRNKPCQGSCIIRLFRLMYVCVHIYIVYIYIYLCMCLHMHLSSP
ncbi:unnamed protein product [Phytomonas sp. EM1]|nr:unnamed protein product [Phytomonas sp. EM1]|eukprot:CCW61981.1 unnamed protein product [Phytomonas sp. isolate EM1]